uniref:protein-tyrosine-phosphatase n=1 Tax=Rhipicephalus appendiculatus TaxID=34631 RepID=A0A131YWU8_RHIAP
MPFVRWRKGDVDLTADGEVPLGRNDLLLENVRESANYTCVASSTLGSIEHVAQVIVQEEDNQHPTYSQGQDAWAYFGNFTEQDATTTGLSDSAALNATVLASLAPAASVGDHVISESVTTPAKTAVLTGRVAVPQRGLAEEAGVRIALLREEHALRMRLIQEDHDDVLKKRDEEHKLKMEIFRRQKEIQDFVLKRLQEGK